MKNFKSFAILAIGLLISCNLYSQDSSVDKLKNLKARSIGPAGMSGRVTSIDVIRDKPDNIIIGSASGGVWMSTSAGVSWEPIFDDEKILNIGSVAFQQSNPSVIWVGTGEGNPRNSQSSGAGIYKSIDKGKTWRLMGLENTKTIHRIIVDPVEPNTVYAASLGSAWGPNPERGVFKTIDGGESWEKILFLNDTTGCADLVMDPSNPNKLIAAMWQYQRQPWFFESGGKSSGLYISYDGGKNWKKKTSDQGLPDSELGRIGLAIAPSKTNVVYALIESAKTGLYRSNDGGEHWKLVSTENIGNRPFYYADIFVDTKNENRLYNLYSLVSQSEDGGKSFKVITPYSNVHPDHHALYIHPDNPDFVIDGNDGGLNISKDGGKTWRFVENLPLGQFYHINVDNEMPYNIYGGMQDNGSWIGPAYKWQDGGMRNSDWQELLFGDGFDVVPHPKDSRYGYAMYQGGNVYRYDRKTGESNYIQPIVDTVDLRFNWNAAIAVDPFNSNGLYFGSQFVHKSADRGNNWKVISPDLTSNDSSKQNQALSGGLTIDATKAENYTSLLCIEASRIDSNLIWVGTDDGKLQKTINGGDSWEELSKRLKSLPEGSWIPQIHGSRHNKDRVFVVANNYRRNDWKTYAYKSEDGGKSFVSLVSQAGISGYALCVLEDPIEPKLVFLGTEQGLWISFNAGKKWQQWTNGLPSVSVTDLKIQEREGDLVIGTFGRSIFVLDDIEVLRQIAKAGEAILDSNLIVFDPPIAVQHSNFPASGVRFAADAHYKGQNRWSQAQISLYLKEGDSKRKSKKAKESSNRNLKLEVFDANNQLVRTQKFRADTGLNRVYWDMRFDGHRMPMRREIKEDDLLPAGLMAYEGKYKVKLSYKDWADSSTMELIYDPNWNFDNSARKKQEELYNQLMVAVDTAFNDFEKLKKMAKAIGSFRANFLADMDTSLKKSMTQKMDSIDSSIKDLQSKYMLPKEFKGYNHVTELIGNKLGKALQYCYASEGESTSSYEAALKRAVLSVMEAHKEVSVLVTEQYNPFVDEVLKLNLKPIDKL